MQEVISSYRYRKCGNHRMTIQLALETLGVDFENIRMRKCYTNHDYRLRQAAGIRKKEGFWQRNETKLESLAYEAKIAYRRAIKQVGHDFDENKEEAQIVINAYSFIKRKLKDRGVVL